MNKLILGGALVTLMGGVPGATYLLTRDSEDKNTTTVAADVQGPQKPIVVTPSSPGDNVECESPCDTLSKRI